MNEIVTIDGRQFELIAEYPLTEQQIQQTISDIRKQSECSSCNKTQSLNGSIQTLTLPCINVEVQVPATIAITNVTISGVDCSTGTCPPITCTSITDCTITRNVAVTFTNSGDQSGNITPTLTVNTVPATGTRLPVGTVTVSPGTPVVVTFFDVTLSRGPNSICAGPTLP